MNIVFVCTGNTCRSPMAEAILKDLVFKNGVEKYINVISAGICASDGSEMSSNAKKVLAYEKIPFDNFKSKILSDEIINRADIIITMTKKHKEIVKSMTGNNDSEIYTLTELSKKVSADKGLYCNDVMDPFGMALTAYKETYTQLRNEIEKIFDYLLFLL